VSPLWGFAQRFLRAHAQLACFSTRLKGYLRFLVFAMRLYLNGLLLFLFLGYEKAAFCADLSFILHIAAAGTKDKVAYSAE